MNGNPLTLSGSTLALPALFAPTPDAGKRFIEFFTTNIRNPNTRKAYARAAGEFAAWCETNGLTKLRDIKPVHVAAYIESLQLRLAAPSVKQHLAAIRMLFDWLVIGQVLAVNPAARCAGRSIRSGKARRRCWRRTRPGRFWIRLIPAPLPVCATAP